MSNDPADPIGLSDTVSISPVNIGSPSVGRARPVHQIHLDRAPSQKPLFSSAVSSVPPSEWANRISIDPTSPLMMCLTAEISRARQRQERLRRSRDRLVGFGNAQDHIIEARDLDDPRQEQRRAGQRDVVVAHQASSADPMTSRSEMLLICAMLFTFMIDRQIVGVEPNRDVELAASMSAHGRWSAA